MNGLLTAMIGSLLALTPLGMGLEERLGLAVLFQTRGPVPAPDTVAVIGLERQTSEALGLPKRLRDWGRGVYAELIERLARAGASVIVLDLRLDQPRDPAGDRKLARAIAAADRVVLFEFLDDHRQPLPAQGGAVAGVLRTIGVHPPLPAFAAAAAGTAPFPLPKLADRRVSQFWAFRASGGEPTLPIMALHLHAIRQVADGGPALPRTGELRQEMVELRRQLGTRRFREARDLLATGDAAAVGERSWAALADAYTGRDSRYLNFYGPAGQIPHLPAHVVFSQADGSAPPPRVAGRIVLVGEAEMMNSHPDSFETVFSRRDGVDLSGVEIAATAIANLLDDRLLTPTDRWTTVGLLSALGALVGLLAAVLPFRVAGPSLLLVGAGWFALVLLLFTVKAYWLPLATPILIQLPFALFLGTLLRYAAARRASANTMCAINYYLPARITAGFAERRLDPAALKDQVSAVCMVTDASRFTTIAEGVPPDAMSRLLDEYFAIVFDAVNRHGGVVTDVVGDGTTAVWTSPGPERGSRLAACRAALEVERGIRRFNGAKGALALPTRIGLNCGPAMLGNVGGSGRFAYSVVGDAVNTAARLESLNKQLGTRILAASAVVDGLDEIVVRSLGRFRLAGKQHALDLTEVLRRADEPERDDPPDLKAALQEAGRGNWQGAVESFAAVLTHHPEDGVADFHRRYCQLQTASAKPASPGLIQLERK